VGIKVITEKFLIHMDLLMSSYQTLAEKGLNIRYNWKIPLGIWANFGYNVSRTERRCKDEVNS
jgi:hypothetical protein